MKLFRVFLTHAAEMQSYIIAAIMGLFSLLFLESGVTMAVAHQWAAAVIWLLMSAASLWLTWAFYSGEIYRAFRR